MIFVFTDGLVKVVLYTDKIIVLLLYINRACDIARKFFGEKNGDSQHTMFTMGHCHIDTG